MRDRQRAEEGGRLEKCRIIVAVVWIMSGNVLFLALGCLVELMYEVKVIKSRDVQV